jgi:hypothetical protein
MDNTEARALLRAQLAPWRSQPYVELCEQVGRSQRFEVVGESGTWYQGNVRVFWDDEPNGAIRVIATIDDGGWRAFVPLGDNFIRRPDGSFVGE